MTARVGLRRWVVPTTLVVISSLFACLLGEGMSRVVLNPVDYLAVDPLPDSILGVRLPPGAGGHDAWGFRNRQVPDSVDVVTIGDSQTYGVSAPAHLSWPSQLANLTRRRVYNLALGGYGPVQYEALLRDHGLSLHPKVVVVGLYFGNDLWDAYRVVYGLPHWTSLRRPGVPLAAEAASSASARHVMLEPVRDWLARHSVLYRIATLTTLGGYARGAEFAARQPGEGVVRYRIPSSGTYTGFTPATRLKVLNLDDPAVREGLRISLDRFALMADECRGANAHLMVALIPTKEQVYMPWLVKARTLPEREALLALARYEEEAHLEVRAGLDRLGIRSVDLLEPLREAAAQSQIYPANDDGHPNQDGYRVMARAVAAAVRDWLP